MAFLGLAQVDRRGNLNVSKFGPKLAGAGGFINISQNAKEVIFVGTFGAGRQRVFPREGKLVIEKKAEHKKFVRDVEHLTFSGAHAGKRGQNVLYVTERCVFALRPDGPELVEVAPGVDIERDILAQMDFGPLILATRSRWTRASSGPSRWDCAPTSSAIPLKSRFTYDALQNVFFINLERYALHRRDDIEAIGEDCRDEARIGGRARLRHRQLRQFHHPAGAP